jgi:hypothetical protein
MSSLPILAFRSPNKYSTLLLQKTNKQRKKEKRKKEKEETP